MSEEKPSRLRWLIAVMLFLAAVLNYIDRQALSILVPTIQKELAIDDAAYGQIVNVFLVAYTISLLLSGRLVDRLGPRLSMALFVGWWSISNMFTAMAKSATSLAACRFSLGLGEAGNWPASTKAVSRWFGANERALVIGLYTTGATLGATIAPVLITRLHNWYHWQAVFVVTGALGVLWVLPWLFIARLPAATDQPEVTRSVDWPAVLSNRNVWLLMVGRLLTDPVWFFYQFWFAKYLFSCRGVSQEQLSLTWLIFLAADIGALAGGFISGRLVKRGDQPAASRLKVMLLCAAVMPLSFAITGADSLAWTFVFAMVVVLAHLAWLSNISALVVDVIPAPVVATCFGIIAAGSALGGILMTKCVVWLLSRGDGSIESAAHAYGQWFIVMAVLHPVAWLLLKLGGVGRVRPAETAN